MSENTPSSETIGQLFGEYKKALDELAEAEAEVRMRKEYSEELLVQMRTKFGVGPHRLGDKCYRIQERTTKGGTTVFLRIVEPKGDAEKSQTSEKLSHSSNSSTATDTETP